MSILDKQYYQTPFYGVERLLVHLKNMGYCINRKRVRRLMQLVNWRTLYPETHTTVIDIAAYKYPYLLRGLQFSHNNHVWAIDITYIPMEHGFMYLFAVIDIYSRYIVGWDISNSMTAEWCVKTIEKAIREHGCPEIINSDQGSQFTSEVYVNFIKSFETIRISMDGRGRAIDNIYIERFWRSIKYENIYLHAYEDGDKLWAGIEQYMKFYNELRYHQSLSYKTPYEIYYGVKSTI
jgi:putative transposase